LYAARWLRRSSWNKQIMTLYRDIAAEKRHKRALVGLRAEMLSCQHDRRRNSWADRPPENAADRP